MYENYEFPHVHTYEGDLGWLIHAYKKLVKDYSELLEKVTKMEDDFNNINPTINAAIAKMEAELKKAIAEMNDLLESEIAAMKADINAQLAYYFNLIIQLEDQVSKFQVYLKRYVDTKIDSVKRQILAEMERIAITQNGWNPVYGKVDTIQKSMDDTYKFDSFGITAGWLAAMGITVQEITDMRIPAGEWDTKARWYLWHWWLRTHPSIKKMSNPWTGEMDDVRHVLITLIGMHQEGVTAQELADANLTVEQIAESETTAYDHDWSRGWFEALLPKPEVTTKTRTRKVGN